MKKKRDTLANLRGPIGDTVRGASSLSLIALRAANLKRCEASFHPIDHWDAMQWGAACAGEIGEALNVAKKLKRRQDSEHYRESLPREDVTLDDLADELADAVIYLDLWAASQDIDLGEAVVRKFNRTSERVGSDVRLAHSTPAEDTTRGVTDEDLREGEVPHE